MDFSNKRNEFILSYFLSVFLFRYGNDDFDEDQVDYISKYHYEQFGVGYVGEPPKDARLFVNEQNYYDSAKATSLPNYKYVNSARDLTLPLQKHRNDQGFYESPDDEEVSLRKYLGVSVGLVSLITENLLSHPFVVLRRQCQVHHSSSR